MSTIFLDTWRVVRWPLLVLMALYVALVIYRIPAVTENSRTEKAVGSIHAHHITLDDVVGKTLPPAPEATQNDMTVEGIDSNHNGIRDDVELAIFKQYQADIRIRAAELQYALALQVEMTDVFNTETWAAAAQEDDRGFQCIASVLSRANLEDHLRMVEARTQEVENLVFNTQLRRDAYKKTFQFTTSFGLEDTNVCDIPPSSLSG